MACPQVSSALQPPRATHRCARTRRPGPARVLATALVLAMAPGIAPAPAWAQGSLYRCGNTYSQVPCSADAQPASVPRGAAPDRAPGPAGAEACAAAAMRALDAGAAAQARLESSERGEAEVIQYAGQALATHTWRVTLALRTPDGLAAGLRSFRCHLSEDERRVLRVAPARP